MKHFSVLCVLFYSGQTKPERFLIETYDNQNYLVETYDEAEGPSPKNIKHSSAGGSDYERIPKAYDGTKKETDTGPKSYKPSETPDPLPGTYSGKNKKEESEEPVTYGGKKEEVDEEPKAYGGITEEAEPEPYDDDKEETDEEPKAYGGKKEEAEEVPKAYGGEKEEADIDPKPYG